MLQKRYEGFLKTPCLWETDFVFYLKQFEINSKSDKIDIQIDENLRLGKYIERFVSFELTQQKGISILSENIQIQDGKITLGELDFLIFKNNKPIHLEVIYKFYLYDSSVGTSEIEHFIGPNRKDSLIEKLIKLKNKQLPLLYSNSCKLYLDKLNLNAETIEQHVYFKAQLFVPFTNQDINLKRINMQCISGFYIKQTEVHYFDSCKFYIPNKKDWLVIPHTNVDWLIYPVFKLTIEDYYKRKFSPLCWMKLKNGEIKKVFLVWW